MGETGKGFFANGENLENHVGRRFDSKSQVADTEIFKNQNKQFKKNLNSEIVKKIFRSKVTNWRIKGKKKQRKFGRFKVS